MQPPRPFHTGKVRDNYRADEGRLLVVASDRISVFDVVLPQLVPGKGKVLTAMTEFWFRKLFGGITHHMITTDMSKTTIPRSLRAIPDLAERGMLVHRADMVPIECIVRGYLYGSVVKEYKEHGTATGIPLPGGLVKASKLPEPIFTPSTKATVGHDVNIGFDEAAELVGRPLMERIRELCLDVYVKAAAHALERGIILADTKFELGHIGNQLAFCDEVLTPDSSRFWELATWQPGEEPVSYDKQFVRNYYLEHHPEWDHTAPAPDLPDDVIAKTQVKYHEVLQLITS